MRKYYKYNLNMGLMNVLTCFLCFFLFLLFGKSIHSFFDELNGIGAVFFYLGIFGYFMLHELFHGVGYSFFAKKKKTIKYGIVLEKGVFYAMCQEEISKIGILISLLFPVFFLSIVTGIIGYCFSLSWLVLYSFLNFLGAVGDITMVCYVLRLPDDITYIDYDNNIGAYFVSKEDLSSIKSVGMKFVETCEHSEKLIDYRIPSFYVSKPSMVILAILFVLICIVFVLSYL